MKKRLTSLLFCLVALSSAAQALDDPLAVARRAVDEVMRDMRENEAAYAADRAKLDEMVQERLLPRFDFEVMTRLAAGKYWARADPGQQQDLVQAFRTLLVRTYTNILFLNREDAVTIAESVSNAKSVIAPNGDALVTAEVTSPSEGKVSLMLRMRKGDNAEWKVIDISVNGVSLIVTYRGDFTREIGRGGIEGLIKSLRDKNRENAGA